MKNYVLLLALAMCSTTAALAQAVGDYQSNAASFDWSTTASWQRWNGTTWIGNPAEGYPGQNATGIAGTVTIQNGHTVIANTDVTANDIGNLTLLGSGILNFNNNIDIDATGTLTMNGTSQITGTNTTRTLDVAAISIPATATNTRITNIRLTISGNATIDGALDMSSTTATINGATNVNPGGTLTLSSDTGIKTFSGRVTVAGTWTSTAITTTGRLIFGGEVITTGTFACGCN